MTITLRFYSKLFAVVATACSLNVDAQVSNPSADASIKAFNDAFLITTGDETFYKSALNTAEHDGTWTLSLDIFGMQDTYERSGKPADKKLVDDLCKSFLSFNPTPYNWDGWNDDLAWMGLGLARGYQMTGTETFLAGAEHCFNLAYDRGWNTIFNNGGIWEQQPDMTPAGDGVNKQALSNNPNGKLACLLYEATGNVYYKNKAIEIYNWSRNYIFDPSNGQVFAGVARDESTDKGTAVYNQGSFIDFAAHLYKITGNNIILRDAQLAANYVINNMTTNGIISNSAEYLNTWADEYARGLGHLCMWNPQLWNIYYPFLKKNADTSWNNRRTDLNITWNGWDKPTPVNAAAKPTVHVSAVSLQQFTPTVQSIENTIEAEDYNFMSGVVTEDIAGGGKCVGSIESGDWVEYIVNVPSTAIYTLNFNISCENESVLEIQQNNTKLASLTLVSSGNFQTYNNVAAPLKLIAGIQSLKLKVSSGKLNVNKFTTQNCQSIIPSVSINNNVAEQVTSITLNTGDKLVFNPQPTTGAWSWTGPNNFTSNVRAITFNTMASNQGGTYTAKHIDETGCISIQDFVVTINGCVPSAIVPGIVVNNEEAQQTASLTTTAGNSVTFDPQPSDGVWSWTGPNDFSSSSRTQSFISIDYKHAGEYTATYTNAAGCKSTKTFSVALTGSDPCSSAITPYININGVSWQNLWYGSILAGGTFTLGPQSLNGTWQWTGPNGFTSDSREINVINFSAADAGHYIASFTNSSGCVSVQDFIVGLNSACSATTIVPEIIVDETLWSHKDSISVHSGSNVSISYPEAQGTWSWIGPNKFTADSRSVSLKNILFWKKGKYIVNLIDANACISSDTFTINVVGDDYCGTPIVPIININNGEWVRDSVASVNLGDKFKAGPHPDKNMWTWIGPSGFKATTREITLDKIVSNQAGVYTATYTNNLGCFSFKDFTIKINKVVTGVDNEKASVITCYPNPAASVVTIHNVPPHAIINISDLQGHVLMKREPTTTDGDFDLDISDLKPGLYLLKVGNTKTLKFLKH